MAPIWGASGYYDINPTASYILTYALPLQRLYITGKNAIPANTLDSTKIASAIAAATFHQNCTGYTTTQLITSLSDYDPVVRNYGAIELATRSLTTAEINTLTAMVTGTGLKGEYYDNMNFTNLKVTRTDPQVNFDWGTGSPDASIGADTFSVRWSGLLLVPETGTYMFSTLNSDGVRLYVNGVAVIDDYVDQTTNWKDGASINLTAGQMVDLQMEYYENTGSAVAKLKWTGPSFAGANGLPIAKEWLFDGTGISNRTAYAHAQSVSLVQNAPQAITRTGSGANVSALTYAVVSQPAHGTLTGTPPNLTYTPAANFNGSDSFSFLVNDGTTNSSPATVSIGIWAGLPVSIFWTNAVAGNWSGTSNWTDASGVTVVPAAGGQAFYALNFNKTGTYTTTHDLNNGYLFNQLNVAGTVTFAGTSSLSPAANGPLLPQINQNSINAVAFSTPLSLAAMTTMGGTGGGAVTISSLISGAGGLNKDSPGTLSINNVTNTYSGGTIINSGTISLGLQANAALGTGPVTINQGGTLVMERVYAVNPLTLNGGTIVANNGFGDGFNGLVTVNSNPTIDAEYNFTFNGSVSGVGGFTKTGNNTLILSGTNSFTGPNSITGGILSCSKAAALGSGPLDITTGAKVTLSFSGTRTIAALTFNGGAAMAPGTYGSSASPATNKNDTYFTGTGTVTILPATSTALALTGGGTPANPGTPLAFTATVTGSSPTGNVAFYAGATLLATSALNGSFQATFTTSSLAIGSYSITAQYAGNATNAASVSAALAIEITSMLAPPPTNLFASPANNSVGLTWTVSAGASGYYVKRSLTSGGPYTVIGNPSSASYVDLTVMNGTAYYYVVSALNVAGECANSSQVSVIPAPVPSTTTLASSLGATGAYGVSVTFTATVMAGATGTVTFKDGSTVLGTGTIGSGQATHTPAALALGSHAITAVFPGDATYAPSTSAPFSYTVTAQPLTITGVAAANKAYDKTAAATLTGGALTGGVVAGETVSVVAGSGTFASVNVGTWAVTATGYGLGGANAGNYVLSAQPSVANASITALPLQLAGTRAYDGTATAAAGILTIRNNLDGANLTLGGAAALTAKDVGARGFATTYATAARVQSATGNTGTGTASSFNVTLTSTPVAGNSLVAVISTRGTSANRVSSITQTGATWSQAAQATNANGTTLEIWHASNMAAGAATTIAINQATLRSAAVVIEYSGILAANSLDQTANASASSTAPVTGTTASTSQGNELWIGGIGFIDSTPTLGTILNSFASVANARSTNGTVTRNATVYALERIVSATAAASSGGTLSVSAQWAGAIATFKTMTTSTLALGGSAAGNYSLTGLTGSVALTQKNLTVSGLAASARNYDGTMAAGLTGTQALLAVEAAGAGTSGDGKPYSGDALTLGGTPGATFATKHAASSKPVTVTGITLGGAQAGDYTFTQPTGLTATVAPLPLTVAAVSATKTYDRTTSAAGTPTLTPALASGDTTTALSQAFQDATASAGNKVIVPSITIGDGNGGANYALTLSNCTTATIAKATAGVTLGGLARTYDGNPKATTATTDRPGLTITFTYDGSSTPPSALGSYAVVATVGDVNYAGSANGTLVIAVDQMLAWRTGHFSAAEISAGLAADNADADGDGLSNLTEFTLGTDPRGFSPQPLSVAPAADPGQFTLSFVARRASGAGYDGLTRKHTVEGSADLANPTSWQPVAARGRLHRHRRRRPTGPAHPARQLA